MDAPAAPPRAPSAPSAEARSPSSAPAYPPRSPSSSPVSARQTLPPIDTTGSSSSTAQAAQRTELATTSYSAGPRQRAYTASSSAPDPLLDITHLRVRSHGHHCLYPGATFQGTQKSGRNSYDVNVTIVVRVVTSLPAPARSH